MRVECGIGCHELCLLVNHMWWLLGYVWDLTFMFVVLKGWSTVTPYTNICKFKWWALGQIFACGLTSLSVERSLQEFFIKFSLVGSFTSSMYLLDVAIILQSLDKWRLWDLGFPLSCIDLNRPRFQELLYVFILFTSIYLCLVAMEAHLRSLCKYMMLFQKPKVLYMKFNYLLCIPTCGFKWNNIL